MNENNAFLAHHGILGQRWGVRRYQNYDGSLTAAGRKRRGLSDKSIRDAVKDYVGKKRADAQKKKVQQKKNIEKAKERQREKRAEDAAKRQLDAEEALKTRLRKHPGDIYKYRNKLSKEDVDEIMAQVQWDRKCKDIRRDEYLRVLRSVEDAQKTAKVFNDIMKEGMTVYNNTALVNNFILDKQVKAGTRTPAEAEKAKMPKMEWKNDKQQDNQKKDNNKENT